MLKRIRSVETTPSIAITTSALNGVLVGGTDKPQRYNSERGDDCSYKNDRDVVERFPCAVSDPEEMKFPRVFESKPVEEHEDKEQNRRQGCNSLTIADSA